MLNGKAYIDSLTHIGLTTITCPHCGATTQSASGNDAFCNFSEQYINIPEAEIQLEKGAQIAFLDIHAEAAKGDWQAAIKKTEDLLKGSTDARTMYISALFYKQFSDFRFYSKDYGRLGFMEENASSIRESLDLTFKWKEYLFKAVKLIGDETKKNASMDESLVLIKFIAEIRLKRLIDASRTLQLLGGAAKQSRRRDYASMVYDVEANVKDAEASLKKMLAQNEVNAYYYLAKYLAKQKKLDEASALLTKLNERANMPVAQELLRKVTLTQEASKM